MSTAPAKETDTAQSGIAVYALSRGKGVPEATRRAFEEIKAKLEALQKSGAVLEMKQQRIGIEGEIRLCARFADKRAASAEYRDLARYKAVDLLNVVLEDCERKK